MVLKKSAQECLACGHSAVNVLYPQGDYTVQQCVHCNLAYLFPSPTESDLAQHYEQAKSANYSLDIARARDSSSQYIFNKIARNISPKRKTWLDLGCFDGALLDIALSAGYTTYGIELQQQAVEIARRRHGDKIIQASTFCGQFPRNEKMSIISAVSVIEHLLNPLDVFEAAQTHLTHDGLFLLQTPDITSLPARLMHSYWPCLAAPEHIWYFSTKSIEILAQKYGFRVTKSIRHWKTLPVQYGFHQLQIFGEKLYRKVGWLGKMLPPTLNIHAYIGEKIFLLKRLR